MDRLITNLDREVLVDIVKVAQKQGLQGVRGGWKDYLDSHDKRFGSSLCDPAKRSLDILVGFLETFTQDKDCKFFGKMISRRSNRVAIEQFIKNNPDRETPQQRLVRMTVEHALYTQNYSFPSHDEEWMIVPVGKVSKAMKSNMLIAIDCEMVLCEDGTDAVVRVCAVDQNLEVRLDEIVNPNKAVADYRTDITGIAAKNLEGVTCSLDKIQKSLKKLLSHGTILVGHSLHNDMKALKIDHSRVIDTSFIFKFKLLPTAFVPSLNNLCKSVLGYEIRKEGEPHDCLGDARAAMKLVLSKLEQGFDDPIAIEVKHVARSDLAKLLIHKIPFKIPCQDLRSVFPMEYNIDIQTDIRVRGQFYSTFVVFKNASEADAAFKRIEGVENQDLCGRLQKHVSLEHSEETINFFVRKMGVEGLYNDAKPSKKRVVSEGDDDIQDSKRQKFCSLHECDHVKEIEGLRRKLCEREEEIFNLQKILCALTRKHGL